MPTRGRIPKPKEGLPNPLYLARQAAGVGQHAIATFAQVGDRVVEYSECGLYIQPPTRVLEALSHYSGIAPSTLRGNYEAWVPLARKANYDKFTILRNALKYDPDMPIMALVEYVSNTEIKNDHVNGSCYGFCRALIYPPEDLRIYIRYGHKRAPLSQALAEVDIALPMNHELVKQGARLSNDYAGD